MTGAGPLVGKYVSDLVLLQGQGGSVVSILVQTGCLGAWIIAGKLYSNSWFSYRLHCIVYCFKNIAT